MKPTPYHSRAWRYQDKELADRLIERTTIVQALASLKAPDATTPALTWYENGARALHLNYRQLIGQVMSMATWLRSSCGVGLGDRAVVISSNCPEALIGHLALMSIGAITVPVNNSE